MLKYTVSYVNPSSGNSTIEAASASDAKAIVESKGNSRYPYIVYKVSGPDGTIDFMSYGDAQKAHKQQSSG
ncbi:hypothetical protein N9A75_00125 [bacterium]|nr:hypothetical protein [bacterium]MDA8961219.1 hypothetical protein [Akkermansiaceae bacterium]|tara:strand:+ start:106 stop:318 length:213 start_codon:yes stop_codon:yes gene_type:complete